MHAYKMAESDSENLVFPRKLIKNFLLLYKELPCLWDRNSLYYKHKSRRHEAIMKLTELVQQYYKSATRVHTMRKIESLRACARREYKRVVSSRMQSTNPDEFYRPQLWYYPLISFIFEDVTHGSSGHTDIQQPMNHIDIKQQINDLDADNDNDTNEGVYEDDNTPEEPMNFSQYNMPDSMTEVTNMSIPRVYAYEADTSKSKRQCTEIQDEYDAIGINVAAKLRTLPSNMRILAEKLINDVLFQAQMNSLNSSSVVTTSDPIKQDV